MTTPAGAAGRRFATRSASRSRNRGGGGRGFSTEDPRGQVQKGNDVDAEAIAEAVDTMYSMVGNNGQEAILDEAMGAFIAWAEEAVEYQHGADGFPEVLNLRADKYDGTDDIWEAGFEIISEVSGYHDSPDEAGEGQGQEF